MRKVFTLLSITTLGLLALGCSGGEKYDEPDPAPKSGQFDTGAQAGADATGTQKKTDDATSDN